MWLVRAVLQKSVLRGAPVRLCILELPEAAAYATYRNSRGLGVSVTHTRPLESPERVGQLVTLLTPFYSNLL